MLESNDTAYLKQFYLDFIKEFNENQLTQFSKLKDSFQRFDYVNGLPVIFPKINKINNGKNKDEAKILKDKGNNAFQTANYGLALKLYTKSLMKSPINEESNEVSIIRANRSAASYHLEEYQAALNDIDLALRHGYPKDLIYKIKDRKARCLLALKQNKTALDILKETLTALDDAKLPLERRLKWQKDVQIMITMMTKNKLEDAKIKQKKQDKIHGDSNKLYPALNDSIEIKYDQYAGRYSEAKRDIELGEVFLSEDPHCSVLLENQCETHCYHCMKSTAAGEPCPLCDQVKFCSERCQKLALSTYHLIECPILQTLWGSGISITCLMALRIISQKNPKYFIDLEKVLMENNKDQEWNKNQYSFKDYCTVNQLVQHEDKRTIDALIHKTYIAVFLFRCLEETSYFKDVPNNEQKRYSTLIGGLLLQNLQLLQFNAHEIFDLQISELDFSKSKSRFIGGGLYPTLALFNHSCDPCFVRYFQGTKVFARAIKPIKMGEMVSENYGPIFTEMEKNKRQTELRERYWFVCKCIPCSEEWPLLEDMGNDELRFRCDNKKCTNVIIVPTTTTDFIIKCTACGKNINILKGLKVLQDSEGLYRLGQSYLKNGESEKAMAKYTELLLLLDDTLAPPFRDYHLCQQGLRTCYLTNGNIVKI
ncbi:SET and MYND domain-containing protein 4 [Halyomorpha halys]|uniref:SET and MYND domain-containing protein 4 n=1 Tax=Halyomorpha halys TaxID=286706 RepID=UPI0006D4D47F|nr:SET and MYND domain-containing protein 4-like [Halyomorpha halys]